MVSLLFLAAALPPCLLGELIDVESREVDGVVHHLDHTPCRHRRKERPLGLVLGFDFALLGLGQALEIVGGERT